MQKKMFVLTYFKGLLKIIKYQKITLSGFIIGPNTDLQKDDPSTPRDTLNTVSVT